MRRVIILNYHFPPIGGAGSLRGVKLVRQLPELGYEPVIITGPGDAHGRWRPKDATLAEELGGVEVHRIRTPEPPRSTGWRERSSRWIGRPGPWERWLENGLVEAGRAAGPADLVYADLGPDATARAAARLAASIGCPCVVDLQDPWALDEMRVYQTGLQQWLDRRRMHRALSSADAVVMNTAEATAAVRRAFPRLAATPVHTLPYGYDGGDFDDFDDSEIEPVQDAFRIVHTGSFHTKLGQHYERTQRLRRALRGGAELPVDVLTRSPVYLVQAVERLLAADPSLAARLEIVVAGLLLEEDRAVLARCRVVREAGFTTHAESVRLMRTADLLFLPMQNLPKGVRARAVPCKTYEYLASGRPVLAAVPDGDGRDLLERSENVFLVRPDDADGIAATIAAELSRTTRRETVAESRASALRSVERRELNAGLAQVFDETLAVDPATGRRAGDAVPRNALPREVQA
jgi:glycosyltransferase involved in cell wall biosynthesis